MKTKLRILLLEDNDVDARLIRHELKTSGFDFHLERIQSEAELRHEMEAAAPDLILSDHGLPSFDGFKALEIVRDKHPELPFIFVSGSNDQGMVERMYDAGATDYVFKDDIRDLAPAVREALAPPSEPAGAEGQPVEPLAVVVPGGQLHFCPSCRRAYDASGTVVDVLEFCRNHGDLVVQHELCVNCRPASRIG